MPVGSGDRTVRSLATGRGDVFRFELLPVGDEGEQILLLNRTFVFDEREAVTGDDFAVVPGGLRNSVVQLSLGHGRDLS